MQQVNITNSFVTRGARAFIVCLALFLCGCSQTSGELEPTPEAAKQFLKLRGYNFDEAAFVSSVRASDLIAVNAFLAAGINPNAQVESEGNTALIVAASIGDLRIVKALLKGNAAVNLKNKNGSPPFVFALEFKHDEVAESLLAQPAFDVNASSLNGKTPLMTYVWRDREDIVTNLLERGANVKQQDADGDTALHGAVVSGNLKVARLLLTKGANVNARNKVGGTPLMWAGTYGRDEIARELLANGGDPRLKDEDGHNASYWAVANNHQDLAAELKKAEGGR
jgi:ankyrin repeat protein